MTTTDGSSRALTLALTLLVLINLFNYIDRQVLAAVEPEIRKELLSEETPDVAKFRMGLLATAFLFSYMLIAPVFGFACGSDAALGTGRIRRDPLESCQRASGLQWGVPIALAFWLLLITRCFVGVGEAAYGPVGPR